MRNGLTVNDKVREYVLDLLEKRKIREGEKIIPAREIAKKMKISFVKALHAIDSLCFDGILETIPRKGIFVKPSWETQRLRNSMFVRTIASKGLGGIEKILNQELPWLRVNKSSLRGDFELEVTLHAQTNHNEYMDLSAILNEIYPDKDLFYEKPFESFKKGNVLYAIPLIFSPRVICYNADMLTAAGCDVPDENWRWDDFLTLIRKLKTKYRPENIYDYLPFAGPNMIMAFVFLTGGGFIDSGGNVIINSEKSKKGLLLYKSLLDELNFKNYTVPGKFEEGSLVFTLGTRQRFMSAAGELKFNWGTVPLPYVEGGTKFAVQTTECLCVHKSCTDLKHIKRVVKVMLSEKVQRYFARNKYGIPIRRDVAERHYPGNDPKDKLFFDKIPDMTAEFHIDAPEIFLWLRNGLNNLLYKDETDFDKSLNRLNAFFETYLEIERYGKDFNEVLDIQKSDG